MNVSPERELGDKLIKISDMEMDLYNHHRQLRIKLYYLAAVLCGLGFIPCWVFKIFWWGLLLPICGIILLQLGRYERLHWKRIYENLVNIRSKSLSSFNESGHKLQNQGKKHRIVTTTKKIV